MRTTRLTPSCPHCGMRYHPVAWIQVMDHRGPICTECKRYCNEEQKPPPVSTFLGYDKYYRPLGFSDEEQKQPQDRQSVEEKAGCQSGPQDQKQGDKSQTGCRPQDSCPEKIGTPKFEEAIKNWQHAAKQFGMDEVVIVTHWKCDNRVRHNIAPWGNRSIVDIAKKFYEDIDFHACSDIMIITRDNARWLFYVQEEITIKVIPRREDYPPTTVEIKTDTGYSEQVMFPHPKSY